MKVIFDRSAFHGSHFTSLRASTLLRRCRDGSVTVHLTQTFLDETIATAINGRNEEWKRHLEFALDASNGGLFVEISEAWKRELVEDRKDWGAYLLEVPEELRVRALLRGLARSGDVGALIRDTRVERDETAKRKRNQREIMLKLRAAWAAEKGQGRVTGKPSDIEWGDYRTRLIDMTGQSIMRLVKGQNVGRLVEKWRASPERYPMYTSFLDGMLYHAFHASTKHSEPIDINAQADYEQLCFLNSADVFVSNDERFFKSAFDQLWAPKGKRLLSTEQFVAELETQATSA